MANSFPFRSALAASPLLAALLVWGQPAAARAWPLGPPPPLPPLPNSVLAPRWERIAQRPRLRWERVPSSESMQAINGHNTGTLAIARGPAVVEFIQEDRPARRWELVQSPSQQPRANRADRLELLRIQPIAKVPFALTAEQPLGQQAISAPCSASFCNLRVMGRVWFRF